MAYLIQLLLPVTAEIGARDMGEALANVRDRLTVRFGGMTFYQNAPAEGLWSTNGTVEKDAIVIAEVMADDLHCDWWANYRRELEERFQQKEIVIRALPMTHL